MDALKEINRKAVFSKLDKIMLNEGHVKCNDLIDVLSTAKESDKRMINGWGADFIYVKFMKCGSVNRACRVFTPPGIVKYIHAGHIYSYENACLYFKTEPIDKKAVELKKCLCKPNVFHTYKIMKFLFNKRKQSKLLGKTVFIQELINWLDDYENDDIIEENKKYLLEFNFAQ